MKNFEAKQMPLHEKFDNFCVEVSTCVAVGGGLSYVQSAYKHPGSVAVKYLKGFTLAEVLITLGILGVVSALTMPVLIGGTKPKELEAQFKQAYSLLSQAVVQVADEKA